MQIVLLFLYFIWADFLEKKSSLEFANFSSMHIKLSLTTGGNKQVKWQQSAQAKEHHNCSETLHSVSKINLLNFLIEDSSGLEGEAKLTAAAALRICWWSIWDYAAVWIIKGSRQQISQVKKKKKQKLRCLFQVPTDTVLFCGRQLLRVTNK